MQTQQPFGKQASNMNASSGIVARAKRALAKGYGEAELKAMPDGTALRLFERMTVAQADAYTGSLGGLGA